jgi:roadblock/LC7 domain-containing protein
LAPATYLSSQQSSACTIPEPPFEANKPNIFNPQQEQWLGDAQAAELEADYELLPQQDSAELDRIGQKLLAQLPPTTVHYTFRVYESEDANGFSIAGGYVYISRKLITDARSEDEVAGVVSHEVGHIYTHQVAIEFTRQLKAMMKVTSVGDRADVADKTQLLLNAPWKDKADESEDEEEKNELLADRVGMYALIKAGYAPRALAENLDRIAANKGHTGNFLTDVLGGTSEISRRVRVARKISATLPEACGTRNPGSSPEFKSFQDAIRSAPIHPIIEPTPGLSSVQLDPPMRPSLEQVRFSPDGKYILAQDETSIHVLSRSPLKRLFSIDSAGAELAQFTPDSTHVVFNYPTMRTENWDIASAKRESYHELIDYEGCGQTSLSPDGRTFICIANTWKGVGYKLIDVDSAKLLYEDKSFYATQAQAFGYMLRLATQAHFADIAYSQDGKKMVMVMGARGVAWNLEERKQISLGGLLTHIFQGHTVFVDSDKLVYECDRDFGSGGATVTYKICESSFPEGIAVNNFKFGYQWIEQVTHGNHVLIGPFKESAAMLVDPSTGKASAGFKLDSLDIYDNSMASENEHGGVTVGEVGSQQVEAVNLPISPMPRVAAAAFSPDGRFLAYSGRSRSTIWDLSTQKRVALMRPFRAVRFDDQNQMYAQYEESHQKPGQNFHIDLNTGKASEGAKYDFEQMQYGDVLIAVHPLEKTGETDHNTNMQVYDLSSGSLLWSKKFPHDTPVLRATDGDALVLFTDLQLQTAGDEQIHAAGKLIKASDKAGEWIPQGLLVEVVANRTGEIRREIAVPERHEQLGGRDERAAALYGDYLVVRGNYNNSVIYRVSDGVRTGAFYGRAIAGNSELGLIAATNRNQEIAIYDAATGRELKRVTVDHIARAARFIPSKNALLVLTASQRVYSIDLPQVGKSEAPKSASK